MNNMNKIFYGILMGSGFGIVYSSAFVDAKIIVRYIGLVLGFFLYTFGVIKLRDAKNKT